jgi:hypothetical protein
LVDLTGADLKGASLPRAELLGATCHNTNLVSAQMSGADLYNAHLDNANLSLADLTGANLVEAWLQNANLNSVNASSAIFQGAHLEGTQLRGAHLEGADLTDAFVAGANMRLALLDRETLLNGMHVADEDQHDCFLVADVRWGDANLSVIEWGRHLILGDERVAGHEQLDGYDETVSSHHTMPQTSKVDIVLSRDGRDGVRIPGRSTFESHRKRQIAPIERAERAYRQLSVVLRAQGLSDNAARFARRALILHRKRLGMQVRQGHISAVPPWLFSWFLTATTGYGYRMWRIVVVYALIVTSFAAAYFVQGTGCGPAALPNVITRQMNCGGSHTLTFGEALVLSVTAFHGRVFATSFSLGSIQGATTAIEAILGLIIEGVFIGAIRSLETVDHRRGMRGIPCGMTTGCSLTGANPCPSR